MCGGAVGALLWWCCVFGVSVRVVAWLGFCLGVAAVVVLFLSLAGLWAWYVGGAIYVPFVDSSSFLTFVKSGIADIFSFLLVGRLSNANRLAGDVSYLD